MTAPRPSDAVGSLDASHSAAPDVFVARQPIFNAQHKVLGYEVLYKEDKNASSEDDGETGVVVDAVLGFGLGNMTDGETAFIHVTRNMLLADVVDA